MLPLPAIIVLAVCLFVLAVGSTAVVYRYLPAQRAHRAACRDAARRPSVFDDLEKANTPTRKVQVRQGRVVSWHSSINPIRGITRFNTPKPQKSRPGSISSVAPTIDLEREIQSFRQKYARKNDLEANDAGADADINGHQDASEVRTPSPALRPKLLRILSAIDEADNPADAIKESSWEAYNGHRHSNHPLSSQLGQLSPTLEKEFSITAPQRPAAVRTNTAAAIPAAKVDHEQQQRPSPRRALTDGPQEAGSSPTTQPLRLDTLNLGSLFASLPSPQNANPRISVQSALFKSPTSEIIPAAPKPRKPSKLDLRASYSQMDYGFPSPPPSSSLASPHSPIRAASFPPGATHRPTSSEAEYPPSIVELLQQGDFMDLESQLSSPTRSSRPLSAASRNTTHSITSRTNSYRVRKRPPPLPIKEPIPRLPGNVESPALPSPTLSEVASIRSFKQRLVGRRVTGRAIITSKYSGAAVPSVPASPPVFRMPTYAERSTSGSNVDLVSPKGWAPNTDDQQNNSTDATSPKSHLTQLPPLVELEGDVRSILRSATDRAQSLGEISGPTTSKRASTSRDVIAAASQRPNPTRSLSHAQLQASKRPSLHKMQRNASAPSVHKALPPLPSASPSGEDVKSAEQHDRLSNDSNTNRGSGGLSAHPVTAKPAAKKSTDLRASQAMSPTASSSRSAVVTSPTVPTTLTARKTRRSGLDRIASAISNVRSPTKSGPKHATITSPTKHGKVVSPTTLAAVMLSPAALAAKIDGPVVTSCEVAPTPRNSDGSTRTNASDVATIPAPPPVPQSAADPASPAVSAVSSAAPASKRRPPKLANPSTRIWDTEIAVSPLSVDSAGAAVKV